MLQSVAFLSAASSLCDETPKPRSMPTCWLSHQRTPGGAPIRSSVALRAPMSLERNPTPPSMPSAAGAAVPLASARVTIADNRTNRFIVVLLDGVEHVERDPA